VLDRAQPPPPARLLAALVLAAGALAWAGPAAALEPGKRLDQYAHAAWPSVAHSTTVYSIRPARDGYLWVGTAEGLVRLDGQRMTPFDSQRQPGIVDRNIRAAVEARDGALWVASFGGGLSRLREGNLHTWTAQPGAPGLYRIALLETPDGTVWSAGREGIVRFFPGEAAAAAGSRAGAGAGAAGNAAGAGTPGPHPASDGLPDRCTHVLTLDPQGGIWAGTHGGLAHWNGRLWEAEPLPPASLLPRAPIDALVAEPDGTLWVGTRGSGLWRRRDGRWRAYTVDSGLGSSTVSALLRDRAGHLWVATKGNGRGNLAWLQRGAAPDGSGDRFHPFPLPREMCADRIETLAEDGEDGLWIGTELCGLHRLSDRPFYRLTTEDGLPSDLVLGLSAGPGGRAEGAIAGTRGGGMARVTAEGIAPLGCPPGLPCDQCWDFSPSTDPAQKNAFWTVCSTDVVLRWDGRDTSRLQPLPGGLPAASFTVEASDGALWLAYEDKIIRAQGDRATVIAEGERLQGRRILYQGSGGTMWIGTDDAVVRWQAGQIRTVRLPSADRPAEVANFHEDAAGTLWMATKGEGIRRLRRDGDRIATIGVAQGLPTSWIVQVLEDGQGRLWASSSKGIFWVDKRELEQAADGRLARVQTSLYDAADGIHMMWSQSFGHPAGFKDTQGHLWFATNGGIAVIDPASPALRGRPPRVIIEQLRLGGRRIDLRPGQAPVVGGAPHDLDLQFAAYTFAPADRLSFRYRLRGDWVELGPGRSLHEAGLPPGVYQLAIQARTRDSRWSEPSTLVRFTLKPPFHRSPAFLGICALVAALALLLVHRLRLHRARTQMQVVMHERARIAREIHDTLAQAVVATSMQLECLDQALEEGDRPTVRRHLDTAKTVVQETLDEARRSVWVLRPQALENGLVPALQALVRRLSGGTVVELQLSGTPRRLPTLTEANLLRIAGEALANAYRHAHAHRICLRLDFTGSRVVLAVSDDGTGWPAAPDQHPTVEQGLTGMKERATDVGGTVTFDSAPDRGTTVRVEVPA
jgi:signal transduction histidine kinase/ligand-binding sensor domain-containing protein